MRKGRKEILRFKKKGFTLVELLTVIVILGITMAFGIAAVSNLINKAREDQRREHEKTLMMATKSYLQSNSEAMPKSVGEVKKIELSTLRKSNFITEDIKDSHGNSCMKESYVRVYKYAKSKYTYSPYLYCGNEKAPKIETVPGPIISVAFTDAYGNTGKDALTNVSKARISVTMNGGTNTDGSALSIEGYNLSILVKHVGEPEKKEVYNSGTLSANYEHTLVVKKDLKDYIDVTDDTEVTVRVAVRNIAGGEKAVEKDFSATYKDVTPPTCSDFVNEARDENDWKTNSSDSRTITVNCNDGDGGSGCIRSTFSRTWPNKTEREAEFAWISIKDNAGNKNITSCNYGEAGCCKVRVNVDYTSPRVEIQTYKRDSAGNKTGSNILSGKSKNPGFSSSKTRFVADKRETEYIIDTTDYSGTTNNWFNATDFPYGVVYDIKVSDSIHLDRWEWLVNGANRKQNSEIGAGTENDSGVFTDLKNGSFKIRLNDDGFRQGVLRVYDKAGNVTKIVIRANIDKAAPTTPILSNEFHFSMTKVNSDGSGNLGGYPLNTWSKNYLKGVLNKGVISDALNSNSLTLSGFSGFKYRVTNQDGNIFERSSSQVLISKIKDGVANNTNGINVEGTNKLVALSCDKAGNCSKYSDPVIVKIDTKNPQCIVSGGRNNWTNQSVTVYARCSDTNGKYASGCAPSTASFQKTYSSEINTNKAGAVDNNVGGGVYDKAGNYSACDANKTVKIDQTLPGCSHRGDSTSWTGGNRTIYYGCTDRGGSGCATAEAGKTFDRTTRTATIDGYGVTDHAGNYSYCSSRTANVYVDKTAPYNISSGRVSSATARGVSFGDNESGVANTQYCFTTSSRTPSAGDGCFGSRASGSTSCGPTTYYVYTKAVDRVGNNSSVSRVGNYTTQSCCSESNPWGCEWVTSCRDGNTFIYTSSAANVYAGTVKHKPGNSSDKLYVLGTSGSMTKVYAETGSFYPAAGGGHVVWIYSNCINPLGTRNQFCPYSSCPG